MKQDWKPGTMIYPLPAVLVSCGSSEEEYNVLTVAWTGTICSNPPMCYISVRPERHSYDIIKRNMEFVINLTPEALVRAADYCGMYTGAKVDKFTVTGLHREEAQAVSCPLIAESPLSLECKVTDILPQGTHDLFLADVVAVNVEEALLDEKGRLCLERAKLAAFAHGEYFALGKSLGLFGFSAVKKRKKKTAHTPSKKKPQPQK